MRPSRREVVVTEPPNVLLIMADQVAPQLTSPYGDPVAVTPNLQRIADEGICFDAAYTPFPLCAPARASLMTGRDASAIGVLDNASVLPADQPTLGHYLTNHGYRTVLDGKMHFIGPDQLHGFGRRLTTDVFPAGVDWVPVTDEHGRFPAGGHARQYVGAEPGVRDWTMFLAYDTEVQHRALEYLRQRRLDKPQSPFCLVVSYHHPHDPFHVTQRDWDVYADTDIPIPHYPVELDQTYSTMDRWANAAHETDRYNVTDPDNLRRLRRAYYASLTFVDRLIGELTEELAASGELDRTVIIFCSDHGDMLGERGMVQKRSFYEHSARVPLLVRLPNGSAAGTRNDTPVSLIDVLPTILDLVGVAEDGRAPIDGTSMVPLLAGARQERVVFSEYHLEKVFAPCFMVRRDRFKYVYIHGHGGQPADAQLFDLDADPQEWTNLIDSGRHQDVRAELHGLLLERFDPERLAADGARSLVRRSIVKEAMRRNDIHWDFQPSTDATRQYVR